MKLLSIVYSKQYKMIGVWILACLVFSALGGPMELENLTAQHQSQLDSAPSEIHSKHQLEQRSQTSGEIEESLSSENVGSPETSESDESNETLSASDPSSRSKRQAASSYVRSYPNPRSYLRKQQRAPRDYCDYFDYSDGGYAYCCYY